MSEYISHMQYTLVKEIHSLRGKEILAIPYFHQIILNAKCEINNQLLDTLK